ncbi:MAG: ABC transporter ATP-binding protein [Deltaproteobacteria bacterium]|nr:ABC transporter ATP-binding protein [Deltaproteobacteria bacterium]
MSSPVVAAAEPVIILDEVWLTFPLVEYHAAGVKEAFLMRVRGQTKPKAEREFVALRGISVTIRKGETVGIMGRNGSGKTTLLRVMSGAYRPDRGKVTTKGKVTNLQLGSGFREELTGYENVKLSAAIMGLSPTEVASLMEPIIQFADIGPHIYQPLRTYSSGMKARLGFSVASVLKPDILLLDELLAVGDADFKKKSMARMEEMVTGDTTVVIVSHDPGELKRLCTRALLMDKGSIVLDASPAEVEKSYLGAS